MPEWCNRFDVIASALTGTQIDANTLNVANDISVGCFGTVEEIADVILTLARNVYATSQTINVNGGWRMI